VRALFFFGSALIVVGGIVLIAAFRRRDSRGYRWLTPRPATPPGLDPLPDDGSPMVREDPAALAEELARVEAAGRSANVLPSRFSRVIPPAPSSVSAVDPAMKHGAPVLRSIPDPDRTLGVETVTTAPSDDAPSVTPATISPDRRSAPAGDGPREHLRSARVSFPERFRPAWHTLREHWGRARESLPERLQSAGAALRMLRAHSTVRRAIGVEPSATDPRARSADDRVDDEQPG
jgi:hypothetical protein